MQSFTSKELVKEQFSWRYYYWYLTNEGIDYLREYLHLPAEIVPDTLKKQQPQRARAGERPGDRDGGRDFDDRGDRGDRGGRGFGRGRGGGFGRGGGRGGGFGRGGGD